MRICVNEILKKYIFSSGFDEEQDAKDACKPLCDAIDYEVTEVRVCSNKVFLGKNTHLIFAVHG